MDLDTNFLVKQAFSIYLAKKQNFLQELPRTFHRNMHKEWQLEQYDEQQHINPMK